MTTEKEKKPRQMPKGGRKGGSVFPRITLDDAIVYAKKLVSKTHTSPQPADVIYSGVLGAKGGTGNVRMSALKQYGFLKGDVKNNFSAYELAKKIAAAPPDELPPLYREAVLKPTVFRKIFDTFHGDTVSKGKLKQRASDLKVHPDETGTCIDLYVSGMVTAGLVVVEGDQVKHAPSSDSSNQLSESATVDTTTEVVAEDAELEGAQEDQGHDEAAATASSTETGVGDTRSAVSHKTARAATSSPRAVFNVNVTLDSSLDIEKLQKQLELLKRYGAI